MEKEYNNLLDRLIVAEMQLYKFEYNIGQAKAEGYTIDEIIAAVNDYKRIIADLNKKISNYNSVKSS